MRAVLPLVLAVSAWAATPNFSGKWHLSEPESTKGAPGGLMVTIDHRDPVMRIDTEWDRSQRTTAVNTALLAPTIQLMSNGTETTSEMTMGMSITTKSHWDGEKLVTDWKINGLALRGEWIRGLNGAGNMVVDAVTETGGRRIRARFVFVKA